MLNPYVPITNRSEESDDGKTRKEIDDAALLARDLLRKGQRIKALRLTEETLSHHGNHASLFSHHELQGDTFFELAKITDHTDVKCVYLFASVDAYSMSILLCPNALRSFRGYARSIIQLGDQLGINKFYEKTVSKAKRGLSVTQPQVPSTSIENYVEKLKKELQSLMNLAREKINSNAAVTVSPPRTMPNQIVSIEKDPSFDRFQNYWDNLDEKAKREFLVVDFRKLIDYIEGTYGKKVKEYFRKCVAILDKDIWRCWKCHICSQVNYCFTDCKMHILDNHVHNSGPAFSARPKDVDEISANMICCGDWKPVDTAEAANLIKDRTNREEEFVYVNGWCSDWPVANDNERENILKQFAEVLKSSCPKENRTLSCTLWDWLTDYTKENLELPGVTGSCLDKCSIFKNPQCICFLDLKHLEHILKYFTQLTTDVRASLVPKVVNQLWENSQVKERIDLEGLTTYHLLLDKRLLYEGNHDFEKNETVERYHSTGIYDDVIPEGYKIVSWVLDCPEIDEKLVSQMAKGVHNREIWLAVLKIVRCMVRKTESYYDKRKKMLTYERMLGEAETICDREDSWKNANLQITYELALRRKSEKLVVKQDDDTKCFLNVVRDVFESKSSPRFEVIEDMECISKLSTTVPNGDVRKSLLTLRISLKEKFHLVDSKILRNESTYKKLINVFPKLSVVEYRLVVLPFVKKFLQDKVAKIMKRRRSPVAVGDSAEREHQRRHLSNELMQG